MVSIVVLTTCGIIICRHALLRAVGAQLVVAESAYENRPLGSESYLLVGSGDRVEEVAVEYVAEGKADGFIVLRWPPARTVQLGALPAGTDLRIAELMKRGVAREEIIVVDVEGDAHWDWARKIGDLLKATSDANLLLLCDQFASRQQRAIIDRVATPSVAHRIKIVPLPDRRYDQSNWWTCRLGVRRVGAGYLSLAYMYLTGEPPPRHPYRSPDEYEQWFLETLPCGLPQQTTSEERNL